MSEAFQPVGSSLRPSAPARLRRAATVIALVIAVVALVVVQMHHVGGGGRGPTAPSPWPIIPSPAATIDIGVVTVPLARDSWQAWQPPDLVTVNAWEQAIRKHASVIMWYADWTTPAPSLLQLDAVAKRGSIPEITWEPWRSHPAVTTQPKYRLRNIIDGRFDSYIRSWAERLAAYGQPVQLRFAQEMNGKWYPWSEYANGNRPGEFVQAWRHVFAIFRAAGADNVEWVWSPAAIEIKPHQYPGDRYVSMVSLTLFNGGLQLRYTHWRSPTSLLSRSLAQLKSIAPDKPIELSEVGCAEQGGSKAAWIAELFRMLQHHPEIRSVIWYDLVKGSDWRLASSDAATAAFAAGVSNPRYR